MKKIISSKLSLFLGIYLLIFCLGIAFLFLAAMLSENVQAKEKIICFLCLIFSLAMSFLGLWYMNRGACVVWVENGVVKSKGLICGFYKECPVSAIRRVKKVYVGRNQGARGTFIFLVTDRNCKYKKFLNMRKDSYLCFGKNKKNIEFLRTFWSGEIEE